MKKRGNETNRRYKELAMIVLVLFSILAGACTPAELEAIRYALSDAVVFYYNNVYYGTVYVFGRIFYAQVTTGNITMSIHEITQSTALERYHLLKTLGAMRLSWGQVPAALRNEVWSRVQQFGSGGGIGSMTIILLPAASIDIYPLQEPAQVIQ